MTIENKRTEVQTPVCECQNVISYISFLHFINFIFIFTLFLPRRQEASSSKEGGMQHLALAQLLAEHESVSFFLVDYLTRIFLGLIIFYRYTLCVILELYPTTATAYIISVTIPRESLCSSYVEGIPTGSSLTP